MTKELKELYTHGYEVFGDVEKFHKWLECECLSLGGNTPASLLVSNKGIEIVHQTLGQIDHGIFG